MSNVAPLGVRVLGRFELHDDGALPGTNPSTLRHAAARELVAALALRHGRPVPRTRLAAELWPDAAPKRGRSRLRQALWHARTALGHEALPGTDDLALSERLRVDVSSFESALDDAATLSSDGRSRDAAHHLERAIALHRGPLLEGHDTEWVLRERQRLTARWLDALARLVDAKLRDGRYQEALHHARTWTRHDPLDEAAHRAVMRSCALLGRRDEALRAYRRATETLAAELRVEPSAATEALRREIESHPGPEPDAGSAVVHDHHNRDGAPAPFVGRRTERRAALEDLRELREGHGVLLLVEGEPGIGKTRLLRELARDATWRGIDVAWGAAYEASGEVPFGALADLARDLLTPLRSERLARRADASVVDDLARWVPDLARQAVATTVDRTREPAPARSLAFALAELARVRPLLTILDDLHWADDATIDALPDVVSTLLGSPVALALLYRSDAARERSKLAAILERLDREHAPRRLPLTGLDPDEAMELLRRMPGEGLDGVLAQRLIDVAGGHPLFMLAMLDARPGSIGLDGTEPSVGPPPREVRTLVAARLGALAPLDRSLLEATAVADAPLAPSVLADVVAVEADRLDVAVARLTARRLLAPHAARLRISHDVVREAIVAELPADARRSLHARLLDALEKASPDEVPLLAYHAAAAGRWERAVAHHGAAAAQAADVQAFDVAHRHYSRALALAEPARTPPHVRFELALGAETALDAAARRDEQAELLDRMDVWAGNDPGRRSDVAQRRARLHHALGRLDDAESLALRSHELAVAAGDRRRQAKALHALGTSLDDRGRPKEAVGPLERAATLAADLDDARLEAAIRYSFALATAGSDRYRAAPAALERVLELCRRCGDRVLEARAHNSLGSLAMERGRPDEADASYAAALALARALHHVEIEAKVTANLGNLSFVRGDLAAALERLDRASELFARAGDHHKQAHVRANAGSIRGGVLGEWDAGERDLRAALAVQSDLDDAPGQALSLDNLAVIARQRGDLKAARAHLDLASDLLAEAGDLWMRVFNHRSRALVALDGGRPHEANEIARAGSLLAGHAGLRDLGASLRALAGLARAHAHPELRSEAVEEIEAALADVAGDDALQGHVLHLWHAQALELAGRDAEAADAAARAHGGLQRVLASLTRDQRAVSIRNVPEHRATVELHRRHHPVIRSVRLARADAPTGRPLRDDERATIDWTVSVPSDLHLPPGHRRRSSRLMRLLSEAADAGTAPTIADLAGALDASASTIKRDLARLRADGVATPTRGRRTEG